MLQRPQNGLAAASWPRGLVVPGPRSRTYRLFCVGCNLRTVAERERGAARDARIVAARFPMPSRDARRSAMATVAVATLRNRLADTKLRPARPRLVTL